MKKQLKLALAAALGMALMSAGAAYAADATDLATKSGCMACHSMDKKVLGPAFKDVAKKYKGNGEAATLLAKKIKDGGAGTWGPVPMPANGPRVSDADIKTLTSWILAAN